MGGTATPHGNLAATAAWALTATDRGCRGGAVSSPVSQARVRDGEKSVVLPHPDDRCRKTVRGPLGRCTLGGWGSWPICGKGMGPRIEPLVFVTPAGEVRHEVYVPGVRWQEMVVLDIWMGAGCIVAHCYSSAVVELPGPDDLLSPRKALTASHRLPS